MPPKDYTLFYRSHRDRTFHNRAVGRSREMVSWPEGDADYPTSAQMALAGFYYTPTKANMLRATCFYCKKSSANWKLCEEPATRHLEVNPDCGWALLIHYYLQTESKVAIDWPTVAIFKDPFGKECTELRLQTFSRWNGHHPKEEMLKAGFFFNPEDEEDDCCQCVYCGVSLAGFEPNDDLSHEHWNRKDRGWVECYAMAKFHEMENAPKKKRRLRGMGTRTESEEPVPKRGKNVSFSAATEALLEGDSSPELIALAPATPPFAATPLLEATPPAVSVTAASVGAAPSVVAAPPSLVAHPRARKATASKSIFDLPSDDDDLFNKRESLGTELKLQSQLTHAVPLKVLTRPSPLPRPESRAASPAKSPKRDDQGKFHVLIAPPPAPIAFTSNPPLARNGLDPDTHYLLVDDSLLIDDTGDDIVVSHRANLLLDKTTGKATSSHSAGQGSTIKRETSPLEPQAASVEVMVTATKVESKPAELLPTEEAHRVGAESVVPKDSPIQLNGPYTSTEEAEPLCATDATPAETDASLPTTGTTPTATEATPAATEATPSATDGDHRPSEKAEPEPSNNSDSLSSSFDSFHSTHQIITLDPVDRGGSLETVLTDPSKPNLLPLVLVSEPPLPHDATVCLNNMDSGPQRDRVISPSRGSQDGTEGAESYRRDDSLTKNPLPLVAEGLPLVPREGHSVLFELTRTDARYPFISASTPKRDPPTPWVVSDKSRVFQLVSDAKPISLYLGNVSSSAYELNDDMDGTLTSFIGNMPDVELEMTIAEWIQHVSLQGRQMLTETSLAMLRHYEKEYRRGLKRLRQLEVDHDDLEADFGDGLEDDSEDSLSGSESGSEGDE